MPITTPSLLVHTAGQAFERGTVERREVGPHDVLIDIAYAGICHSDIHQAREEWGSAIFPMVPGHEIAGVVARGRRRASPSYAVGDRVGVGCIVDSCRECENCLAGEEQYCLERQRRHLQRPSTTTATTTYGGYSTQIVVDEDFVAAHPRRHRARRRRAAAVRRHHDLLAAAPLGRRTGQEGRDRRHGRPRPHGRARSRTRWAPRSPCSRRR